MLSGMNLKKLFDYYYHIKTLMSTLKTFYIIAFMQSMEFMNENFYKSAVDYAKENNLTEIIELLSEVSNKEIL